MPENKVLIFEPHGYHYEVIPSIAYYFDRLNYKVSILARENFNAQDVFSGMDDLSKKVEILKYSDDFRELLCRECIKDYDFVFLNSYEYFHDGKEDTVINYLGYIPTSAKGILGIVHNKRVLSEKDLKFAKEGRLFALTPFDFEGYKIKLCAPIYFGDIDNAKTSTNEKKLVMIGGSNKRVIIEKVLSENDFTNIRVDYIGKFNREKEFTIKILRHIRYLFDRGKRKEKSFYYMGWKAINYLGTLSFKDMYDVIKSSDYILILMDEKDENYLPFLEGKTSGAKSLSLGFNKPCIISDKFGRAFGFSTENAIFYENDLKYALKRVESISDASYCSLKKSLEQLRIENINESISNLKEVEKSPIEVLYIK